MDSGFFHCPKRVIKKGEPDPLLTAMTPLIILAFVIFLFICWVIFAEIWKRNYYEINHYYDKFRVYWLKKFGKFEAIERIRREGFLDSEESEESDSDWILSVMVDLKSDPFFKLNSQLWFRFGFYSLLDLWLKLTPTFTNSKKLKHLHPINPRNFSPFELTSQLNFQDSTRPNFYCLSKSSQKWIRLVFQIAFYVTILNRTWFQILVTLFWDALSWFYTSWFYTLETLSPRAKKSIPQTRPRWTKEPKIHSSVSLLTSEDSFVKIENSPISTTFVLLT